MNWSSVAVLVFNAMLLILSLHGRIKPNRDSRVGAAGRSSDNWQ